jgi:zinc D-Ala-D-Ala dipeptidase
MQTTEEKQIKHVLPRSAWANVEIRENHESLVTVVENERIVYGAYLGPSYASNSYQLRQTVASMLHDASAGLPEGYRLILIEGVRTLSRQQMLWDLKKAEFSSEHPHWSSEEVERQVALIIARPLPLANHNCGGAVDVGLAHTDGTLVDMGTLPQELKEKKYVEMFSEFLTEEQKINRTILREAMESVGFVWYPGEWWHYCYGDRMWAVYTHRTECMYGPIELEVKQG